MRPVAIMSLAVLLAVTIVAILLILTLGFRAPIHSNRSGPTNTTVEHPGGVKLVSEKSWDFTCVALLSAPKTMKVGDTADVETDLFTTAAREKVEALMSAVQHAADAINNGSAATATDALAGLDPSAAAAIRRITQDTANRQAAADTLPGSPVMTVHLTGPGFDISPDTPERQVVTADAPATWRWTVKAVDAGQRILTVSYNAEVTIGAERIPRALQIVSRNVLVNIASDGFLKEVAEGTSSAKSIAENVSWFWTTLIFPALVFLYGLRKWFSERHTQTLPVC
jgi:hypothetical protein